MRCALTIFVCAGALAAQDKPADAKGSIHGTVKDSTGAPISGISLQADRVLAGAPMILANGDVVVKNGTDGSAVTNESGEYTIGNLVPATYSVKAERAPTPKSVKLDNGGDVAADFIIPANPVISGRVFNQDKEPLVDAFVWLLKAVYRSGVLGYAVEGPKVTNEDGSYTFDSGLDTNRPYYVVVERTPPDDLVSAPPADLKERQPIEVFTYYPSATRIDAATPIVLQSGETRDQVDIRVAASPYFCAAGKITSDGKPASTSLAIHAAPLSGTRLALVRGYTGDEGKYQVCGLPPGAYRLSNSESSTEFLIASADLEHVDLSLDMAYPRLQVDWDGEPSAPPPPPPNAQALQTLRDVAKQMGMDNPSDEDLRKLAANLFLPTDAISKLQSEPDHSAQIGNLMSIVISSGKRMNVSLNGAGTHQLSTVSNAVPAGDYAVQFMSPSSAYAKEITFNGAALADGVLHLAPAQTGTLRLLMALSTAKLAVTVADAEGKPVPAEAVLVVPESTTTAAALSRAPIRGVTDQNGNYAPYSIPPGKYRVLATSETVRWDNPEDLQKVILLLYQAKSVELEENGSAQITVAPVTIY